MKGIVSKNFGKGQQGKFARKGQQRMQLKNGSK